MGILEKFNTLIDFPKNLKNYFFPADNSRLFRKTERLKIKLGVKSLLEIKPFDKTMQYIVAKVGDNYLMSKMDFDKSTGKFSFQKLGRMKGAKTLVRETEEYYPNMDIYESFYIIRLDATPPRKGTGQKLINLAQRESWCSGCKGKVHLDALNPDNPPFYFYRKMGFDSQDRHKIEIIDNLMKNKLPVPDKYRKWCISMYLPKNKTGTRI